MCAPKPQRRHPSPRHTVRSLRALLLKVRDRAEVRRADLTLEKLFAKLLWISGHINEALR